MSYRAHLLSWVELQIKRRLGSNLDVDLLRRIFDGIPVPAPRGIRIEATEIAGVSGEWVRPSLPGHDRPRILYIHGGGFISCSARTHRPITGAFAQRGFDVFAPNYRLAPEHRFPAALDDLVAVWSVLSTDGPLFVAGDSAGGNLALGLMLSARQAALPQPAAAALFSPATDLLGTGLSIIVNAQVDAMMNIDALRELVPVYLGDADPAQPLASPLYADLAGLSPLIIHVGELEVLRDDSTRLAFKAKAAGIEVDLAIYPVVPHAWQLASGFLPEAQHSLNAASDFLMAHWPALSPAQTFA